MLSKQARNGFLASLATIAAMFGSVVLLGYNHYWLAMSVFVVSVMLYIPFMRLIWVVFVVFFISISVHAQKTPSVRNLVDTNYKVMEWTYVALNTIDLGTTLYGLNNGAVEGNPVLSSMHPVTLSVVKAAGTTGILLLNRQLYKRNPTAAKVVLFSANILYSAVVGNNVGIVLRINK